MPAVLLPGDAWTGTGRQIRNAGLQRLETYQPRLNPTQKRPANAGRFCGCAVAGLGGVQE